MATTTVHPSLPRFIDETPEFMLLERMITTSTDSQGYVFAGPEWHDGPGLAYITLSEFKDMVSKVKKASSAFIDRVIGPLEQMLEEAIARGEEKTTIDFRRLSELANIEGDGSIIEVDHVLHSLCERFPEEIPFIETEWGYVDRSYYRGSHGGGASFITPNGIDTMTSHGFLRAKRAEYEASNKAFPGTFR
jgi:hypothetical protein